MTKNEVLAILASGATLRRLKGLHPLWQIHRLDGNKINIATTIANALLAAGEIILIDSAPYQDTYKIK